MSPVVLPINNALGFSKISAKNQLITVPITDTLLERTRQDFLRIYEFRFYVSTMLFSVFYIS
jgi:hypothetical protein